MVREIDRPIFVVGTGRSGSTIFFELFARHPEVAWLSQLADKQPQRLWLNQLIMRGCGVPVLERALARFFGASEAYGFWNLVCPGFSNPCRDLLSEDVLPATSERIRHAVSKLTTESRPRFTAKVTGWPRMRFLDAVFPDALFVHVKRNPCATACSLLEVPFWDGWRGPPNWRRGQLPPDLEVIWRDEKYSFVALAALEIVIVYRAMESCRSVVGGERLHVVEYSELCLDTEAVMQQVCAFCGLRWSHRIAKSMARTRLLDRDANWQARLTGEQQAILLRTFSRAGLELH
jgi:hypothetical protein